MNKYFVSQEQAIKLNKLGFNEIFLKKTLHKKECSSKVNGNCPLPNIHCQFPDCEIDKSIAPVGVPLYAQAFAWFRNKKGINSYIRHESPNGEPYYDYIIGEDVFDFMYDTYEQAEEECFKKLIELLEN